MKDQEKHFDIKAFNNRHERNRRQDCRNIEDKQDGILPEAEFHAAQRQCEGVNKALRAELVASSDFWRDCDITITALSDDNHLLGKMVQQSFPWVVADPESGQCFVYCNHRFVEEVIEYMRGKGGFAIEQHDAPSFIYCADDDVINPLLTVGDEK